MHHTPTEVIKWNSDKSRGNMMRYDTRFRISGSKNAKRFEYEYTGNGGEKKYSFLIFRDSWAEINARTYPALSGRTFYSAFIKNYSTLATFPPIRGTAFASARDWYFFLPAIQPIYWKYVAKGIVKPPRTIHFDIATSARYYLQRDRLFSNLEVVEKLLSRYILYYISS